jgi:hypothetical protein
MRSFYFDKDEGTTKLDELHDIEEVTGKMELEQALWIRLMTNQGEWIFDLDFGHPWLKLFREKATARDHRAELIKTIYKENRVKEILEINVDTSGRKKRKLEIFFKVLTTEGLIEYAGEVEF